MKIIYQFQTHKKTYELTDHLGNVRAQIEREKVGGFAQTTMVSDYYPYGMKMPGRQMIDETPYRYSYQGQFAEKDEETNLHSFELRQWDARIARWNSTDPYGQHFSPYMGMGNNPISSVDPDGGFAGGDPTLLDEIILTASGGGGFDYSSLASTLFSFGGCVYGGFGKPDFNMGLFPNSTLLPTVNK